MERREGGLEQEETPEQKRERLLDALLGDLYPQKKLEMGDEFTQRRNLARKEIERALVETDLIFRNPGECERRLFIREKVSEIVVPSPEIEKYVGDKVRKELEERVMSEPEITAKVAKAKELLREGFLAITKSAIDYINYELPLSESDRLEAYKYVAHYLNIYPPLAETPEGAKPSFNDDSIKWFENRVGRLRELKNGPMNLVEMGQIVISLASGDIKNLTVANQFSGYKRELPEGGGRWAHAETGEFIAKCLPFVEKARAELPPDKAAELDREMSTMFMKEMVWDPKRGHYIELKK